MNNVLITGGGRGIGLQICQQLRDNGANVYAAVRKPSAAIAALGINVITDIDVADGASVSRLTSELAGVRLDLLLNNAGLLTRESFDDLDYARILRQFEVNALGPLRVVEALQDNLGEGAKVGIITSRVGSVGDNRAGGNYGYRMSKAAANMVGKNLCHDLGKRGIAVALLHPGLVATEMTGGTGIAPADAARGILARIEQLNMHNTGTFWHAEGYQLPW